MILVQQAVYIKKHRTCKTFKNKYERDVQGNVDKLII